MRDMESEAVAVSTAGDGRGLGRSPVLARMAVLMAGGLLATGLAAGAMAPTAAYADDAGNGTPAAAANTNGNTNTTADKQATDPNLFVDDQANVLDQDLKTMVAGLDIKYSGFTDNRLSLIVATRGGDLPKGQDISAYARSVFSQLKVGYSNGNKGVLLLIMPKSGQSLLIVGDGVSDTMRTTLLDGGDAGYLSNSSVTAYSKVGDWPGAAKVMVAEIDSRINSVQYGQVKVTTKKTVAPMTVKESKAAAAAAKAKATQSTATGFKIRNIVVAVIAVISVGLALPAILSSLSRRHAIRKQERIRDKVASVMSAGGFGTNPGVDSDAYSDILNSVTEDVSAGKVMDEDTGITKALRRHYEEGILPKYLHDMGLSDPESAGDWLGQVPESDRETWWSSSLGIVASKVSSAFKHS